MLKNPGVYLSAFAGLLVKRMLGGARFQQGSINQMLATIS
jgi:hypothetical protein